MKKISLPFHIWAIADLHLSFGIPNKSMEVFGDEWKNWTEILKNNWITHISPDDLVLLPGDISWAMHVEDALVDLEWIDRLPGTKVMIRGNHDYWWASKSKVEKILPPSIHIIQNDAFNFQGVSIAGARLWDTAEFDFFPYIDIKEGTPAKALAAYEGKSEKNQKVFARELSRLQLSLNALDPNALLKICMTHYPPIGADLKDSTVSNLLEKHQIDLCVFGHLHSLKKGISLFGEKNSIPYILSSCDYLHSHPKKIT